MTFDRIAAYSAFGLTFLFVATLAWIAASWPPSGFAGLTEGMAQTFLASVQSPLPFAVMNLYNASFAVTGVVLVLAMHDRIPESPRLMQFAIVAITAAATLFVASGIIPIVSVPPLVKANNIAGTQAAVQLLTGLVLSATTAAGVGVVLVASAALTSGRLPRPLCWLMIIGGAMEIVEFITPPFLLLDPLVGMFWSAWLGMILWRTKAPIK